MYGLFGLGKKPWSSHINKGETKKKKGRAAMHWTVPASIWFSPSEHNIQFLGWVLQSVNWVPCHWVPCQAFWMFLYQTHHHSIWAASRSVLTNDWDFLSATSLQRSMCKEISCFGWKDFLGSFLFTLVLGHLAYQDQELRLTFLFGFTIETRERDKVCFSWTKSPRGGAYFSSVALWLLVSNMKCLMITVGCHKSVYGT